jgi:hypothetical protein
VLLSPSRAEPNLRQYSGAAEDGHAADLWIFVRPVREVSFVM